MLAMWEGVTLSCLGWDVEKETPPLASCLLLFSSSSAPVNCKAWRRTESQHAEPNSWLKDWSRAPVCQSFGNEGLGLVVEDHRAPTIWINPPVGRGRA